MTTLIALTAAVLLNAAAIVLLYRRLAPLAVEQLVPGTPLTARTVIVNTRRPDDQTIRGVLVAQHADRLTLRDVVYLHGSAERAVDGIVHVPAANVAFVQEIG